MLQSALNYVRVRWVGWLFIAVLASVALWSARVALQTKPAEQRTANAAPLKHEPDFEAVGLNVWRTSPDGKTRMQMQASKIVHYRDDLSSSYEKPRIIASAKGEQTNVRADTAQVFNEGQQIDLLGNVMFERTGAGSRFTAETAQLSFYPDLSRVLTRSSVAFNQGGNRLTAAGGFDYQHADANIIFLGPVRAILPARDRKNPSSLK